MSPQHLLVWVQEEAEDAAQFGEQLLSLRQSQKDQKGKSEPVGLNGAEQHFFLIMKSR